jgi:hypothetical protein
LVHQFAEEVLDAQTGRLVGYERQREHGLLVLRIQLCRRGEVVCRDRQAARFDQAPPIDFTLLDLAREKVRPATAQR